MGKNVAFFLGNLGIGGVERVLLTYANELAKNNYNVTFLVAKGGGKMECDLGSSVRLIKFEETRVRYAWMKLWKYIHRTKPEYLLTGGDSANLMVIIAAMFSGTKVIISQHNYNDLEASQQGMWSRYLPTIMRYLYPRAYKVVAVSQGIKDYLEEDIGIKKGQVDLLYNPLDIEDLQRRAEELLEFNLPEKYILFVGRISPVKNLPLLLEAYDMSSIEDYSLVIVGNGTEMKKLQDMREGLRKKEKIIFTGLSHNPIPIIKKCSLLVLCSYSEAMPTVLLEAMAFNKPIAATPTPGAKEILAYREGTYISKSFDDITEFATILEEGVKCHNSGLKKYAERYDIKTIMGQLEGMLQ